MEALIALFIASHTPTPVIVATYKENQCYKISAEEFRPGTIKITKVEKLNYLYEVWYSESKTWSSELENDIETIQTVYDTLTECP